MLSTQQQKPYEWSDEASNLMLQGFYIRIKEFAEKYDRQTLPSIRTFTGVRFRYLDPKPEDVRIEDIAHALSNTCRFSGHAKKFYSVAQHSVLVSYYCHLEFALEGLLHDASEAYCQDIPRPLKRSVGMEIYRVYENMTMQAINKRFSLQDEPENVKMTDKRILWAEQRDLMNYSDMEGKQPFPDVIVPWTPEEAERQFLMRFYEITGTREFSYDIR